MGSDDDDDDDKDDNINTFTSKKSVRVRNKSRRKRTSTLKRSDEQLYHNCQFHLWREADVWRSDLRARDIQLMLRAARIIPSLNSMRTATEEDVMRVEVATYLLGTGGVVDLQLGEDLHRLTCENEEKNEEHKTKVMETKVSIEREEGKKKEERKECAVASQPSSLIRKKSSFHLSRSQSKIMRNDINLLKLSSKMGRLPSIHALTKLAQWEGLEVINETTMDSSSDEDEEVEVVQVVQVVFSDGEEDRGFVCHDDESIEI